MRTADGDVSEEHLGDPALTPATVASAHHVSVRTLQRRFHDAGLTVAAYIRHRRLERCRRELTDPAHATTTIGVLAARWGSGTGPQLTRAFRAAYRAYSSSPGMHRQNGCPAGSA